MTNFIKRGLSNRKIREFDIKSFSEAIRNTTKRTLILSSLDFSQVENDRVTLVDFSQTPRTRKGNSNYFSVARFLEDSSDIEALFFQIRYKLVKFADPEKFRITKPYMDFTGDGEIVTMGFPGKILENNEGLSAYMCCIENQKQLSTKIET